MKYTLIDSEEKLRVYKRSLKENGTESVAMDFECESNLHCYGERICLIQIFDGRQFFLIDPFRISREGIAGILEDSTVKLFYDASSDAVMVYKQYGIKIRNIFDLRLLVDVLGFSKKSLSEVLKVTIGIEVENKKRFQMHNWTLRPIDRNAIEYALSDVEYLFQVKDSLLERVKNSNKTEDALMAFSRAPIDYDKNRVPGYQKKREYLNLSEHEKGVYDIIYSVRDRFAKKLDWPPNNLLANADIGRVLKDNSVLAGIKMPGKMDKKLGEEFKAEVLSEISAAEAMRN